MTNGVNRRYGIMTVAIIVALISLLTGTKGSPYTVFWTYAAYLSYKGEIKTLKSYLVILIWINAIIAAGVILFVDSTNLQWILPGSESHIIFVIAVGIPLAVKVAILLRINSLLNIETAETIESEVKITNNFPTQSISQPQRVATKKLPESMEDAYGRISQAMTPNTQSVELRNKLIKSNLAGNKTQLKTPTTVGIDFFGGEDDIWERVAEEFEGEARKKGLLAKLFAKHNGDEVKIKSEYYKIRFNEIHSESKEAEQKQIDFNNAFKDKTIDECIENKSYQETEIYGYKCLILHNGCAMVITPKRDLIYENVEALKNAMEENRKTGYFTNKKLIRQTYRK